MISHALLLLLIAILSLFTKLIHSYAASFKSKNNPSPDPENPETPQPSAPQYHENPYPVNYRVADNNISLYPRQSRIFSPAEENSQWETRAWKYNHLHVIINVYKTNSIICPSTKFHWIYPLPVTLSLLPLSIQREDALLKETNLWQIGQEGKHGCKGTDTFDFHCSPGTLIHSWRRYSWAPPHCTCLLYTSPSPRD